MIPDDDMYQSEGDQGMFKQPIVPMKFFLRPTLTPSSSGGGAP